MSEHFEEARQAWLAESLPEGRDTNDDVDDLKAELAYWDLMVADTVLPFVSRREWITAPVDVRHGIADLRHRISECESRVLGAADSDRLRRYER